MDTINSSREFCDLWGIEIIEKRVRRKKQMSGEIALEEPLTREEYVKRKLLEALDTPKEEIASRSERLKEINNRFGIFLRPSELIKASQEEVKEASKHLSDNYQGNFDKAELVREVDDLKYMLRQKEVPSSATAFLMLMGKCGEASANMKVAIELLIAIGSSIAGCEKSFSKLKLIKIYLRNAMRQTNEPCSPEHRSMTSW